MQSLFNNPNNNIFQIKKGNLECKIVKQEQLIFTVNNKENKNNENIITQDNAKGIAIKLKKEQKPKFLTGKKVFKIEGF